MTLVVSLAVIFVVQLALAKCKRSATIGAIIPRAQWRAKGVHALLGIVSHAATGDAGDARIPRTPFADQHMFCVVCTLIVIGALRI